MIAAWCSWNIGIWHWFLRPVRGKAYRRGEELRQDIPVPTQEYENREKGEECDGLENQMFTFVQSVFDSVGIRTGIHRCLTDQLVGLLNNQG